MTALISVIIIIIGIVVLTRWGISVKMRQHEQETQKPKTGALKRWEAEHERRRQEDPEYRARSDAERERINQIIENKKTKKNQKDSQ